MRPHITLIILTILTNFCFGQCKDGFSNSEFNGKKVKIPCISEERANGLTFQIKENSKSTSDTVYIDLVFKNPTNTTKTIYWYDFIGSRAIPLNFKFSVNDSSGKAIWDKNSLANYMDSSYLFSWERRNKEIDILIGQTFIKTVVLWWPSMTNGKYSVKLFYGELETEIQSNDLTIRVE